MTVHTITWIDGNGATHHLTICNEHNKSKTEESPGGLAAALTDALRSGKGRNVIHDITEEK